MWEALRSAWALFVGMALLMVANGLLVTLLSVRGAALGFSATEIGWMQSAYPLGAFIGCFTTPPLVIAKGHVRIFAALASIVSAASLVHLVTTDPWSWGAMRAVSGLCFAGLYIVAESWLNGRADNTTRGALLSIYFATQTGGAAAGQLLLGITPTGGVLLFVVVSILISLSLVPMLISADTAPRFEAPERMSLAGLFRASPMGAAGALLNGVAQGTLYIALALYGTATGLDGAMIGYLIAALLVGGFLGQYPLARFSDRTDRRAVVAGAALASIPIAGALGMLTPPFFLPLLLLGTALIGALTLPIYSICVAHVNDGLRPSQIVAASGTLVLVLYTGIAIGPPLGAAVIDLFGPAGLFGAVAGVQGLTALVAALRLVLGPARTETGAAVPIATYATPTQARMNPQVRHGDERTERRGPQEKGGS